LQACSPYLGSRARRSYQLQSDGVECQLTERRKTLSRKGNEAPKVVGKITTVVPCLPHNQQQAPTINYLIPLAVPIARACGRRVLRTCAWCLAETCGNRTGMRRTCLNSVHAPSRLLPWADASMPASGERGLQNCKDTPCPTWCQLIDQSPQATHAGYQKSGILFGENSLSCNRPGKGTTSR